MPDSPSGSAPGRLQADRIASDDAPHPVARLLLIDDDKPFRETLAHDLTAAGHTVSQADDGRAALASIGIDLVVVNLVMPVDKGLETIAGLRQRCPNLPVIAVSGAAINSAFYLKMAGRLGAHRTLAKPFTSPALLGLVGELLTPSRASGAP